MKQTLIVLAAFAGLISLAPQPAPGQVPPPLIPRRQLSLDRGWRFHLGDASSPQGDFGYGIDASFAKAGDAAGPAKPGFNDSSWEMVDVPHDWVVALPFVRSKEDGVLEHGFKPVGRQFPATTIGWYRRTFAVPASASGERFAIRFDGVFRDCIVWLNGNYLGRHTSGYGEFTFDVTDYLEYGGNNTLVLRVDASQYEGWFYEGAGIYRHTWLLEYGEVHIPEYGVYVRSAVATDNATLDIVTTIANESSVDQQCEITSIVRDPGGRTVATSTSKPADIAIRSERNVEQTIRLPHPLLWSPETPVLYTLFSEVRWVDSVIDTVVTSFGIRTVVFDKNRGFVLNGKTVKLKGVCCHQDHAGVGSALPDRLQYYRIQRLKEMGCNALRTSHNPPTRELLDACDRLGMMVMDENRLLGSSPEMMQEWETLVRRDRNRASVIIWSLGNEEWMIQGKETGKRLALSMMARLRELDQSRTCTYAANNGNQWEGINSVIPVRGFNYMTISDIDKYRKDHPDQVLMGSEEASTVCTRGQYANDTTRGYVCDYDSVAPNWGATAEKWWQFYDARPWLCGAFVWTGFDYRGEPTPYGWPCINSHFGIMDVCGFPKNNFYYYKAWWGTGDVLHLFPHWNWHPGDKVGVWAFTNCDSVELFLNGKSLGRENVPHDGHPGWDVPFVAGTLEARGWRNGRTITDKVETTGKPVRLQLSADRTTISADGEDVSVVTVTALDREGREVPVASNMVSFTVRGDGAAIGVGNGDPSSHEPDKCPVGAWQRSLFNGKCQIFMQAARQAGQIRISAASAGLQSDVLDLRTTPAPQRPSVE